MALAVLPAVFLLTWFLVWSRRSLVGASQLTRRGAFLLAYLLFEGVVLAITELSSIGHHFSRDVVLTSWLLVLVILLILCGRRLASTVSAMMAEARSRASRSRRVAGTVAALRTETAAWLVVPVVYFGIFVYLGLAYLPSNADSLDYHLARVMHWIENQSVGPFAAHFTAQVSYAPLTEYNLAHFHLLYGSDGLDGFVQLFAALVCLVAVSEITRLLGGSNLAQAAAVVVCTTVPSLVLSATSTGNNLFAASLGICLLYALLGLSPLRDWWSFAFFVGLAASLAYMTKGTVVVLIGPAALAILIWRIVTERGASSPVRFRSWAKIAAVMLVAAVVVAGPFIRQNESLFGSAEGPDAHAVVATNLTWRAAGADIVRSVAANFMMGNGQNGPETAISKFALREFHDVYDVFGVPEDNSNYFVGSDTPRFYDTFEVRNFTVWDRKEDEGADPLDVLLLLFAAAAAVILLVRGDRRMRLVVVIAIGLTVGFLVFAGISRWQIYQVRLFLPIFVAWTPLIALALTRISRWLLRVVLVLLVVASLPQLFDNAERPVLRNSYGPNPLAPYFLDSTDRSYIVNTAMDFERFSNAMTESSCRRLGIGNFDVLEYPVWVGLRDDGWNGEIQDVDVDNPTNRYEDRQFHSCAILTDPGGSYVGTDARMVQIPFDTHLALAITPQDLRSVPVAVEGFSSGAPGVRVVPGAGWDFGQSTQLTGVGTFFIYSTRPQTVTLRIDGPGASRAGISTTGSGARGARAVSVPNDSGVASLEVSRGVTEVELNDVPAPGQQTQVYGIRVDAAEATPGG